MTTWKMPDPPDAEVTTLWDVYGTEWTRQRADGGAWRVGPAGEIRSWDTMIWRNAPLSDVPPSEQP